MNNQNKYALLIGINKYSNLPPHYQLSGCINGRSKKIAGHGGLEEDRLGLAG